MIDVILLAGNRPGVEILSQQAGTSCKALVPIVDKPMLYYPLRTLLAQDNIRTIWVLHQDVHAFDNDVLLSKMIKDSRIIMHQSTSSISNSVHSLLKGDTQCPVMLTTGDNVLLSKDMIEYFIQSAAHNDLAVAMVESSTLLASYPESKRTWLKFKGGKWSGANLFWFNDKDKTLPVLEFWQSIEQDRKKGRKIISAFGLPLLLASLLRLITLPDALTKVGKKFNLNVKLIAMPQAEACIDVDKPEDIILTEKIIENQK